MSQELDAIVDDERRRAVRALLRKPLLVAESDPDAVTLTRRHRDALVAWFQGELGYRLVVESEVRDHGEHDPPVDALMAAFGHHGGQVLRVGVIAVQVEEQIDPEVVVAIDEEGAHFV